MIIPLRLPVALFTASLLTAATANITSLPAPADPIAPLNVCIQQRFQEFKVFGMTRVLPNRNLGVRQFHPENATEGNVLTELRNKGYEVALFLVGRYALDPPTPFADPSRSGLQGPAIMTAEPKSLPDSAELLTEGRKALRDFAGHDGYDLHKAEWVVAMRPLRASNESCIQCHAAQRAKLGDALGVAMYVYRKTPLVSVR